jgi:hypothetical protein
VQTIPGGLPEEVPDRLAAWATRYLALAVVGVRSPAVTQKIALHLDSFVGFFHESYGHDRIGTCLRRDGLAWQRALVDQVLAPATVNNHLASLSAFTTWVAAQAPAVFPVGGPAKGIRELGLPPLDPRALSPAQVRSLKNLCDCLERFHRLKGQRWAGTTAAPVRAHGRPWRDRAIVYVFLSTALRQGRQGRGRGRRALTLTRGSAPDLHDCAGGEPHAEALEPEPPPAARYWSKVR